jgi:DNA-binding GntR family transcriptional regulator
MATFYGGLSMPLPLAGRKVSRTLAREEAYSRLRSWIIEGTLQPEELLRDQEVAAALGVSRTPVREALRRLEDEGFVETALNRWTRVTPLDFSRAAETYAVIEALELLALELAFPQLTDHHLERLIDANRAMRQAARQQQPAQAVLADERFHEVWIQLADNGELTALLGQLKMKLRRVELAYFDAASRAHRSYREHAAIIQGAESGSLTKTRAALKRNWRESLRRLRATVESRTSQLDDSCRSGRRTDVP